MGERGRPLEDMDLNPSFWRDKRVLVTGHTGFKGGWLCLALRRAGASVAGFSLDVPTVPSFFVSAGVANALERDIRGDVRDPRATAAAISQVDPDVVFHLAAQSLVLPSYRAPAETYATNVMGTMHVLDGMRSLPQGRIRTVMVVTSDKCYALPAVPRPLREGDSLGGHDPYSSSKACAEILTESMRRSFFADGNTRVLSVRAGNVVGGGDWAPDRLIPDLARSGMAGSKARLRHPKALRPWQHVLDPVAGYLRLAELAHRDAGFAEAWNLGPDPSEAWDVGRMVDAFLAEWTGHPGYLVEGDGGAHEASWLLLDATRARQLAGWRPRFSTLEAVRLTARWYVAHARGSDLRALTQEQLDLAFPGSP